MASEPDGVTLHVPGSGEPEPGAALIAAMQASPHKDIEIEPARGPMPVSDASL